METEADKEGNVRLELLLPADIRGLRLDPAEAPCLVKIKRILGELGGSYNPGWSHNGRELEQQGILYTTTDPQIVISGLVEGTGPALCGTDHSGTVSGYGLCLHASSEPGEGSRTAYQQHTI